jgi:hypothetical protein
MGDAERTEDRGQTCRKLGSGGLVAQMETHNSSIYFFSILSYSFTSFLVPVQNPKTTLASLISLKVSVLRLALSYVSSSFSLA